MNRKIMAIFTASLVLCTAILTSVSASNPFTDVKDTDWFYNDVEYVRDNKLMSGVSDSEFSPSGITTRGMIVTVLWRLDGSTVETGKEFEDVKQGAYYYDAVAWASNNGIVSGYSETTFGPDDTATREQLATIVYRYASYKKYDVSKEAELDKYADKDQISGYAEKSIKWANANGLITGTSEETISPKNDVQRSQLAAILKRFCVNIVDEKTEVTETPKPTNAPTKDEDEKPSSSGNNGGGSVATPKPTAKPTPTPTPTPTPEAPASPVELSVETVEAAPGEEVTVAVNIANNPGLTGMRISVSYGDDITLIDSKSGEAVEGLDFTKPGDITANPLRFLWDALDADDGVDGTILYLTFKVNDDANEGDCEISVEVLDLVDADVQDLPSVVANGAISISK